MRNTSVLTLALAAACGDAASLTHETSAAPQAALPQTVRARASAPFASPGDTVTFTVTGAPANRPALLFVTNGGEGRGPCIQSFGGCLDILPGSVTAIVQLPATDASGRTTADLTVPSGTAFDTYTFQAVVAQTVTTRVGSAPFTVDIVGTDCPTDDAFEENDDAATQAAPITGGTYTGLGLCDYDAYDWYTVTLAAGERVIVDLSFTDAEGDLDLFLFENPLPSGVDPYLQSALDSSESVGNSESISYTSAAGGTYYVLAHSYRDDGTVFGNTYDMTVAIDTPPDDCATDDAYEDNDDLASATALTVGAAPTTYTSLVTCADDEVDYYSFSALAGETIDATITFDNAEADLDLFLLDALGIELDSSGGIGSSESISLVAPADGTYVILVSEYRDSGTVVDNTYDLSLTVTPAP